MDLEMYLVTSNEINYFMEYIAPSSKYPRMTNNKIGIFQGAS